MNKLLIENHIDDIIRYLSDPDGLKKQTEGIIKIKRSKAFKNLWLGIVALIIGIVAIILNSFSRTWLLLVSLLFILLGCYVVITSMIRASRAPSFKFATDLQELCKTFYFNALCKNPGDLGSKDDHIVDVCQFIPVPVLENYATEGWDMFIASPRPRSASNPLVCTLCSKKAEHRKAYFTSLPINTKLREEYRNKEDEETKNLIKTLYLKCKICGKEFCYECLGYTTYKGYRFICPACGKATNGWKGLGYRWTNLRNAISEKNIDFTLSSVIIEKTPRPDSRVFDLVITLNGQPFSPIHLTNVAINIGEYWFLATPEYLI